MARFSASMYEEEKLPVQLQREEFAFGEVVYFTIGSFENQDMVCLQLSPEQLAKIGDSINQYRERLARILATASG